MIENPIKEKESKNKPILISLVALAYLSGIGAIAVIIAISDMGTRFSSDARAWFFFIFIIASFWAIFFPIGMIRWIIKSRIENPEWFYISTKSESSKNKDASMVREE